MVQEFSGKYKLVKNENFVEYLEANGKFCESKIIIVIVMIFVLLVNILLLIFML